MAEHSVQPPNWLYVILLTHFFLFLLQVHEI